MALSNLFYDRSRVIRSISFPYSQERTTLLGSSKFRILNYLMACGYYLCYLGCHATLNGIILLLTVALALYGLVVNRSWDWPGFHKVEGEVEL